MKRVRFALALSLVWVVCAGAEEPVQFGDARLKEAVEDALWVSDPTPADMLELTELDAGSMEIESIVGLEYATNLQDLRLRFNRISDISPLAGLTNLEHLVLHRNWLGDLSPLTGLTNLVHLDLNDTHISDISDLAAMTWLQELILYGNKISDLSALTDFTSLRYLDLRMNPLSDEVYDVQIPQIMENNPGITIEHDRGPYSLTTSSTRGGSIIDPGEGTFVYDDGTPVRIEAQADPGFVFVGFSGTLSTSENPAILMMGWDYDVQANFESVRDTLYVDDDAPEDPGANNANVSDPRENGSPEHPFDRIQEAIDVAKTGAVIYVRPGVYHENIKVPGKTLQLVGREPNEPVARSWPVIQASRSGAVVYISGKTDSYCLLTGFVITAGQGQAGTVTCSGATATISHCLLAGNRPTGFDVPLLQCTDSNVVFANCTMADNHIETCNGGIQAINSQVALTGSIFYFNSYNCWGTTGQRFFADEDSEISISYCNVTGGWPGEGNIEADPLFVRRGRWVNPQDSYASADPGDPAAVWSMGDYHLQSNTGRWDSPTKTWVADDWTSPCIDGGDPLDPVGSEPVPNGDVINMGVYGGTTEASQSPVLVVP